ncbi:MAG: thioredoxin domain-containing protein [Candidatus Phytoplasma stylosanthis]|nr:thioredoxin domain-containing protein [Candidatus Phytoplasma stylosanthis]
MLQNNNLVINEETLKTLINQEEIILIDFFANWCKPCKILMNILDSFIKKNKNIKLIKIDVDLYPKLTLKYNITSFPTLILFKFGKEVERKIGLCSEQELSHFIEKN